MKKLTLKSTQTAVKALANVLQLLPGTVNTASGIEPIGQTEAEALSRAVLKTIDGAPIPAPIVGRKKGQAKG